MWVCVHRRGEAGIRVRVYKHTNIHTHTNVRDLYTYKPPARMCARRFVCAWERAYIAITVRIAVEQLPFKHNRKPHLNLIE